MSFPLPTLIVLTGPTASGKTDLAIRLAQHFGTEIISADSRQFYREIPIGTAAPTAEQLQAVPHHFVGHLSVKDDYNVHRFEQEVLSLLDEAFRRRPVMLMAGGSGLYIDAVCKGIDELPDPDPELRERLNRQFETEGIEALQRELKKLDPDYYEQVDLNNSKRIMRAIEVCLQTGKKYSELRLNQSKERPFRIVKIGLEVPREELNRRISQRTDRMLEQGWLDEARSVYPLRHLNALNTVGFKELFACFDGEMTQEQAVEKIKTNTRRFAKRQMTWFRKDGQIRWFAPDETQKIIPYLEKELAKQ